MHARGIVSLILVLAALTGVAWAGQAPEAPDPQEDAVGRTPPRLSFVDGQVSFWRPGAQEWTQAQINTPLAPGDQVYTGSPGNLELQIGGRAFVRGWANTHLGFENHEPDFLQFKVTAGRAAFDLRTLEPGRTVEVNTPNAAFTIEHPGYYRVDVIGERTSFITRRAGRATVIPAGGESATIAPSEEVVVEGVTSPQVSSYVAPQLDEWDKWNYARTDVLLDAVSARHVPPGTYGVADLDRHGTWRVVDDYGSVWVPTGVPRGWAPYTTGAWTLDPYYGWTWVDTAPWGWAPYHYGRWVSVRGFWAWAPGPVVARPIYAPALVAFLGGPGVSVSVGFGGPVVGWVALGWGEPVCALVGAARFRASALVGRLGRAAGGEQRGRPSHDRRERAEHQRLSKHQRAERRGGGQRKPVRPRPHRAGARDRGGCALAETGPHRAPGRCHAGEFRAYGAPWNPASRGGPEAVGGFYSPAPSRGGVGLRRGAEGGVSGAPGAGLSCRDGAPERRAWIGDGPAILWTGDDRTPHGGTRAAARAAEARRFAPRGQSLRGCPGRDPSGAAAAPGDGSGAKGVRVSSRSRAPTQAVSEGGRSPGPRARRRTPAVYGPPSCPAHATRAAKHECAASCGRSVGAPRGSAAGWPPRSGGQPA